MRAVTLIAVLLLCRTVDAQVAAPFEVASVATFAEEFFPREMERRRIPGVVFIFVHGGEIAIARGFGAAELEPRRPVDPSRTIFRLASVSKVITATAALQLVERQQLALDADVNSYLKSFQLPARHGPITLHHLLTHTAGFDERLTGAGARSADDVQPSARYLARSMPPTFIEPGRVISYSNHGFALIGHLVEETSGRSFAAYVREEVFAPLGMERSGSLSARIPEDFAVAYEHVDGQHRALAPDYLQVGSAGAFYTTGADMGRFLIAHLEGGAYGGERILRSETVDLMHTRQFAQAPGLSGWGYGVWEDMRDGQRALLHNGGGKGFRALMYLLPQQHAGFFIAYNLADRHTDGELQELFITRFRKQFLPATQSSSPAAERAPAEPLVGEYRYVRRARTTIEKFIAIPNAVRVTTDNDGGVRMAGSAGTSALIPIAPLHFRRADGRGVVAFDGSVDNPPQRLVAITDSGFPAVYERIPWFATMRTQGAWLLIMAVVFLYASLWRPVAALVRSSRDGGRSPFERPTAWLGGIASALNLLVIVGVPLTFLGRIEGGVPEFLYGVPLVTTALLFITPATGVMAVATAILAARGCFDKRSHKTAQMSDAVIAIALLSFSLFAWYWRLIPPWS